MVTAYVKKSFIGSAAIAPLDPSRVSDRGAQAPKEQGVAIGPPSQRGDHQALNARASGFDSPLLRPVLEGPLGPEITAFREEGRVSDDPYESRVLLEELDRAQLLQLEKALRSSSKVNRSKAFAKPIRSKADQVDRVLSLLAGRAEIEEEPLFPFGHPLHEVMDSRLDEVRKLESDLTAWQAGKGEQPGGHQSVLLRMNMCIARGSLDDIANVSSKDLKTGYTEMTRLLHRVSDVGEAVENHSPNRLRALECREALIQGKYKPDDLRRDIAALEGKDGLAMEFAEVLFGVRRRPPPVLSGTREMLNYAPTCPDIIVKLADAAPEGAVLYDCGSGLGLVPMMYSFLTGNPAHGVERDPALCGRAKEAAAELGLEQVSFLEGDAREATYEEADLFFFFNPFNGSILETVFDRLKEVAKKKPIQVAQVGGGVPGNASSWLEPLRQSGSPSWYQSVPPEVFAQRDRPNSIG